MSVANLLVNENNEWKNLFINNITVDGALDVDGSIASNNQTVNNLTVVDSLISPNITLPLQSFSMNWNGAFDANGTTILYQIIGNQVVLGFPVITGTVNTSSTLNSAFVMPTPIAPTSNQFFSVPGFNNGVSVNLCIQIGSNGLIEIGIYGTVSGAPGALTASANGGINSCSVIYNLN